MKKDFTVMKNDNLSKYAKNYKTKANVLDNLPVEVFLEASNCCNIKCLMCASRDGSWKRPLAPVMPLDLIKKITPFFNSALLVHAFGFGEPLLNKNLLKIVCLAKNKGAEVDFFTNGTLLSRGISAALVKIGVDQITISFNAGTSRTYEKIHKGAQFDKVIENVVYLNNIKKMMRIKKPKLVINYIAMNMNFHELPLLVDIASSMGVELVEIKELVTYGHLPEMISERRRYSSKEDDPIIELSNKIASQKGVSVFFDYYRDNGISNSNISSSICFQPWRTLYVASDGNVKPCCFYWDNSFMGNLYEESIEEIWNNSKYQKLRNDIAQGIYPEGCKHCLEFSLRPIAES